MVVMSLEVGRRGDRENTWACHYSHKRHKINPLVGDNERRLVKDTMVVGRESLQRLYASSLRFWVDLLVATVVLVSVRVRSTCLVLD